MGQTASFYQIQDVTRSQKIRKVSYLKYMRIILFLFFVLFVALITLVAVFFFVLTPSDRRLVFTPVETVSVQGEKRSYRLVNASPDEPRPLLIGLHGFRDRSWWMSAYSGLHILAEKENATLALPSGQKQSWNGIFCCGWAYQNNVDDVAFITSMIDDIRENNAIDGRRIYVVGFSNGGILAQRLLHERPDLFAAGVSVMSGVGDRDTTLDISNAQAPLLLVQGTSDTYVPLNEQLSSGGFNFLPANDTADIWASHYGLSNKQLQQTDAYDEYTWGSDSNNQLVQQIYDTSHRWPQWRIWRFPDASPDSTQQMWNFLYQHRL
jgi:polyhydroxybutyrate depolymerase